MKTAIRTILCAVAVVMAAASCQKSIEPANPAEEGKGTIDICVNGLMGEYTQQDGVKSSLVNNVRVAWAAGDVVYVFDGSKYLGKLTAALDKKADGKTDEDRYAKLGGTISAPATTPCVLSLVHSSLMTEPAAGAAVSELSIDMSAQSTATVPFVAFATLKYTGTTITDVVVPFQFATSVIKVNCTGLKANTAIDKATLSNVNTVCKFTLSGTAAPSVSGDINGTITRTGDAYFAADKVNEEGEAVFQIAVPALEAASGARVLAVKQGSSRVGDKNFSMKKIAAATSVNTVCQLSSIPIPIPDGALPGVFTVSNDDGQTTKQIFFSKGNLVATIDASGAPTAWKFSANQYDYIGGNVANTSIGNSTTSGTAGDVDLFGWSTDAASNNWGIHTKTYYETGFTTGNFKDWGAKIDDKGTWCTLSIAEWQYLFNTRSNASSLYKPGVTVCGKTNCVVLLPDNWEWDKPTDEPKVGTEWQTEYPATSDDKVTWKKMEDAGAVCLPAAGKRDGSKVDDVGVRGYYWSSTADASSNARDVNFDSNYVNSSSSHNRCRGFSVRLITECQ